VSLPSDENLRLQVFASTEYGTGAVATTDVRHEPPQAAPRPRLYLIAAGINNYADRSIPQLEYAVNNAEAVATSLAEKGNRLYGAESVLLLNNDVSRPLWSVASRTFVERLRRDAGPDDLLVVFLSGHGIRDPKSDEYFYVTAGARHMDLQARRYDDCISLDDFSMFADIPCRKLVILDTCHSGAVQPLQQSDLKTIVRALENDLVFTLTASEGNEPAFESPEDRLGFFTASLVEALGGAADRRERGGNADGQVDLAEAIHFVQGDVPQRMGRTGLRQYPTAAPSDLLNFARIPLTAATGG
jgi:uncharacterized caspase-like protein